MDDLEAQISARTQVGIEVDVVDTVQKWTGRLSASLVIVMDCGIDCPVVVASIRHMATAQEGSSTSPVR